MKTISALAAATLAFLPASLLAEGKGNDDWAEKAARGYEEKARWAEKQGKPRAAAIYSRMAEIKREAGRASKNGKKFSWDEYHELEGKLNALKKDHHKVHNKPKAHDGGHDKGHGFLKAADQYRKQAMMAREKGDTDKANIYNQLAEMKVAAANNAKEGKGYDWAHYYELKKKLHAGNKDCDKPNKDCDKPKREWNASDKPAPTQLNIE